ncbi:MAG: HAD family phosphatase [Cytophagales bacterium]|nr:HAD family phosphatase [Cytophagales bacterium]
MKNSSDRLAPNLLFDLGGVIMDIDLDRTVQALVALGRQSADDLRQFWDLAWFKEHETGHCNDGRFRDHLRELLQIDASDADLDRAWNALLIGVPAERIALLRLLRQRHGLYLLSNTNGIHVAAIRRHLREKHNISDLSELFDGVYYSHEIGKRKPDPAVYTHVLADAGLAAHETVFFDDSAANLAGAAQVGLQTVHIRPGQFAVTDYFK